MEDDDIVKKEPPRWRKAGADWMSKMPWYMEDVPLFCMAIPGSHNSCSFYSDQDITVDRGSDPIYRQFCGHFGELAADISHRWTLTQSRTLTEQLDLGVRYLDMRVTARAGDRHDKNVFFKNGPNVLDLLREIRRWSDIHPKEIILLDFRVTHKMEPAHHRHLLANIVQDVFEDRLLHCAGHVKAVTLRNCWAVDASIIVFYPKEHVYDYPNIWPNNYIGYVRTDDQTPQQLIETLDRRYRHGRPPYIFYCWDGVLTTSNHYLATHLGGTLKEKLSKPALRASLNWTRNKDIRHGEINIVVADFVHLYNFCTEVVKVNFEMRDLKRYEFESQTCTLL